MIALTFFHVNFYIDHWYSNVFTACHSCVSASLFPITNTHTQTNILHVRLPLPDSRHHSRGAQKTAETPAFPPPSGHMVGEKLTLSNENYAVVRDMRKTHGQHAADARPPCRNIAKGRKTASAARRVGNVPHFTGRARPRYPAGRRRGFGWQPRRRLNETATDRRLSSYSRETADGTAPGGPIWRPRATQASVASMYSLVTLCSPGLMTMRSLPVLNAFA